MRHFRLILLLAVAIYLMALSAVWHIVSANMTRSMTNDMHIAIRDMNCVMEDMIASALYEAGECVIHYLDNVPRQCSKEELDKLMDVFQVDEINIVARDGTVLATTLKNVPKYPEYNFYNGTMTQEFKILVDDDVHFFSQKFRPGVHNPENIRKYAGVAFPNKQGFVQIGSNYEQAQMVLGKMLVGLKNWKIGENGYFLYVPEDIPENQLKHITYDIVLTRYFDDQDCYVCLFDCFGYRLAAILPAGSYWSERNQTLTVSALALLALFIFFTFFLYKILSTSTQLVKLHAIEKNRVKQDMSMAWKIQHSVLPPPHPFAECTDFSLSAMTEPAKEIGGDFYDYLMVDKNTVSFLVADVAGKGIPGAMFMMESKSILREQLSSTQDLEFAVAEANRRLCENNEAEMFVTALVAVCNRLTGVVTIVNAGHNPPYLKHANGTLEYLKKKGGLILGVFENAKYSKYTVQLLPGDMLFLYTDGITEAMNPQKQTYGRQRLEMMLEADDPAEDFIKQVRQNVAEFVGSAEQSDDFTALVFRWNGSNEYFQQEFPNTEASIVDAMAFLKKNISNDKSDAGIRLLNASDEILSNIVNYSEAQKFMVRVEKLPGIYRVQFRDNGKEWNPLEHLPADVNVPFEKRQIGGLGILMARKLVDDISYDRKNSCNILTINKKMA